MLQIREKHLGTQALLALSRQVCSLPNPHAAKVLVNSRLDIALAAGADGVHLTSNAPAPSALRPLCPDGFLIGVSCHTLIDVRRASEEQADFIVYGPVFDTPGKAAPVGIAGLRAAVEASRVPLLALGGITWKNAPECESAGAAGIAGIRLFSELQR